MSKTTSALLGLLVAAVMLVLAIIAAAIGFGWFADSTEVSATGMSVSTKGDLQIRKESNGADIGVIEADKDMPKIEVVRDAIALTDGESVSPGASGSFSFYVYSPSRSSYTFACDMGIVNDQFADNFGYYNGVSEENKSLALQYANSHIMLFTNMAEQDGMRVYSGWIQPGEPLELTAADHEQLVTVYWVWVPFYDNIFSDSGVGRVRISDDADGSKGRQSIMKFYKQAENAGKLFAKSETGMDYKMSSAGYNEADHIFGSTIQKICFDVYVREV